MTGRNLLEKLNELSEEELDNPVYDEYGQDLTHLSFFTETLRGKAVAGYIQLEFGESSIWDVMEEF
jgi:hypothetical protein